MNTTQDSLANKIQKLPDEPGVYKYFNNQQQLIYVGKAKSLKKRVSSYFNTSNNHNLKTTKLVSEIADLQFIVVNTEFDALLLENNLIKENQPKYNILLKDDKTYPFICISKERFPKIYSTRELDRKNGEYFGPFSNTKAVNTILELIHKLYTIRTCSLKLSPDNIESNKFKVCLEYHIGNCLGPCEGMQNHEDYLSDIEYARHILKGNLKTASDYLKEHMQLASENMDFEKAQLFKNKLEHLESFQSKTIIVNANIGSIDVITAIQDDVNIYFNYLKLDNGMITVSESIAVKLKLDEQLNEIIKPTVLSLRQRFHSDTKEIISNIQLDNWDPSFQLSVPVIGDKKKLIELSIKNSLSLKKQQLSFKEQQREKQNEVLKILQSDLQLQELPLHIECFDNSNIQGTNPVASMVCFRNGKPAKKDYRHFKIKTVIGPDDFKSMNEVVSRRYARLKNENLPFPQLVIVDGGKGQLHSACDALKDLGLYGQIPIIGIAKRLEEIYYPEDSLPIYISKKSPSLRLIQHLRDEAHRFAINFHRDLRSKHQITSPLDSINGIGPKTKALLLKKYKSYNKIKSANTEELISLIGKSKTELIQLHIKKGNN